MPRDCSFLIDLLPEDRVSFEPASLESHATDRGSEGRGRAVMPDAVVWPETTDEIAAVLAAATERGVPVTPYAAGTGLEGGAVPTGAGISLDMTRLDAVVEVRADDRQVDVEAGVLGSAVNEAVASEGLFFPPLPSSGDISTIGGMVATDASGMGTVKYGEVADWVLELEVVLADGSVITVGSKAAKTSSGYNLKELIVGSEGTLGVVTRATLELAGRPEQIRGGRAAFPTLDDAAEAVVDAVRSGVDVAKIELLDGLTVAMANDYLDVGLPDAPMVFVEFHANHGIEEEVDFCRAVFEAHDVSTFEVGAGEDMEDLWTARRELFFAVRAYDPDLEPNHPGDVTVPISRLPDLIRFAKDLAAGHDLLVPMFGHAGDGNVHYTVLTDPSDSDHDALGEDIYRRIVERSIDLGGTATGEHGIGLGKREYLEREHGTVGVELMRSIKDVFDPTGILNPGKIFPDEQ